METKTFADERVKARSLFIFAGATAAAFLVLLYGSIFKGIPMGINVLLFIAVIYASMLASFPGRFRAVIKGSLFQTAAVVLLAAAFLLFGNLILLSVNGFLIAVMVGAQYRYMLAGDKDALFSERAVGDASIVWLGYTFAGMKGAFSTFGQKGKSAAGVLIGVAITGPVLAAVIALLMSADSAFSKMLEDVFAGFNPGDFAGYTIVGVLLFALSAGLYFSLRTREVKLHAAERPPVRLSRIAVLLPAVSLSAVLALFAVFQFAYLFAGKVPEGFTYATYAQNGFWQLVAVAVIVAAVVFFVKRTEAAQGEGSRALRTALAVLCALTEVVLVSAFWRMTLYEQAYSFSILRIFTQAFMVATAGVFGVLIAGLIKPSFNVKKWIYVVGMVCYIALNYMNADAFIARQNIAISGDAADIVYLTQLSADALPYYADRLPDEIKRIRISEQDKYYLVCRGLNSIKEGVDKAEGWQYYNVSRDEAKVWTEKYAAIFKSAGRYVRDNPPLVFFD